MYQCCAEFTTIEGIREVALNAQPQYQFEWECLMDAQPSFQKNAANAIKETNNENDDVRRCLFTRVHINDMNLLNKGDKQELQNSKKKRCQQQFFQKVARLGYSSNLNFSVGDAENSDDNSDNEQETRPPVNSDGSIFDAFNNVNFQQYPSKTHVLLSNKNDTLNSSIKTATTATNDDDESIASHSGVNDDATNEQQQLTMEEKLHFNFAYDTSRDERLIAKNAKRNFKNDKEMMKYWHQRYRYFTKLDKGCLLDREGWFSVTPELLARHVADRLVRIQDCVILDAFAGAGGNAIQFALRGAIVFAIDIDPIKLVCSARNAQIYGASERINFICGDFFHIAKSMFGARQAKEKRKIVESISDDPYIHGIDVVNLSPPWGGPSYAKDKDTKFDLKKSMELDGYEIFHTAKRISPNIVYYLPKETLVEQLIELAGPNGQVELEQAVLNKKIKVLNAYYGQLVLLS